MSDRGIVLEAQADSVSDAGTPRGTSRAVRIRDKRSTRRTRILFLIDQLSTLGGGERALIQIVRGLGSRFQCSVATFRANVHPEAMTRLEVPVTVIPIRRTWSFGGLLAALQLRRIILEEQIDIVHTFFETSDLFGGMVAKLSGAPVLISSRRDMGFLRSRKHNLAYRLAGRMFDRVLTVSEAVRARVMQNDKLDPDRVKTLYTGVSAPPSVHADAVATLRRRFGIPATAQIVLTVANILPWKGHHEFLEAAALVHETFPEVHFLVAGGYNDPVLFEALRTKRDMLQLDRYFHYLGEVRPVAPLYQMASVFCLLSDTEGLPNVVLEAMAAGTPVVATRVGGTTEIVQHGKTGLLVNPGSPADAAARIAELLYSPHRANQIADAARTMIDTSFSLKTMIHDLEDIYDASLGD